MSNEKLLQIHPALYPYLCSEIKTTAIPSGQYSFSADDIFQGLVPCHLIIGLVASASYMGDYGRNPFYFRDYDVVRWASILMGNHIPLSHEANQYVYCYRTLTCFRMDINVKRNIIPCTSLLLIQYQETRSLPTRNEVCQTLIGDRHHDNVRYLPRDSEHRAFQIGYLTMKAMTALQNFL